MKCLCCGKEIKDPKKSDGGWHVACIRRFFGMDRLPAIDITEQEIEKLVKETVRQGLTVPGVQKKLSLHLSKEDGGRLTLVDYPTGYILKPQTKEFAHLPEAEDLVMRMAEDVGIATVPHALINLPEQGNVYAYITKRIDRVIKRGKTDLFAMEDFCQLAGRLVEDKYRGSYELCAKILFHFSSRAGLDMTELYLRILFSYLIGNSDMHLKNFSLIETSPASREYVLSPAYDMLPVNLILPEDKEQLALTLGGKKRNLRRNDFIKYAKTHGISEIVAKRLLARLLSAKDAFLNRIEKSYLPPTMSDGLRFLLIERMESVSPDQGIK